jgi:CRP-like cAMP-binding protein
MSKAFTRRSRHSVHDLDLEDGARIEVGMVGFEGMIGLPVLLGSGTSPWEAMVQVDGRAWRMPASTFRSALAELPSLIRVLLRYLDAVQPKLPSPPAMAGIPSSNASLVGFLRRLTALKRIASS